MGFLELQDKLSGWCWHAPAVGRFSSPGPSRWTLFCIAHLPPTTYRLSPFLFNNIPAFYSYLLCFHGHSRFTARFSAALLCFQQHSRVVPSKKESLHFCSPSVHGRNVDSQNLVEVLQIRVTVPAGNNRPEVPGGELVSPAQQYP